MNNRNNTFKIKKERLQFLNDNFQSPEILTFVVKDKSDGVCSDMASPILCDKVCDCLCNTVGAAKFQGN